MNTNPTSPHYDDEIDLKVLLKKAMNVLDRGTKMILCCVLIGGILGIAYFLIGKTTYQSRMVITSDILVMSNIRTLFDPFELLIEERDTTAIAQKLQIEDSVAAKIKAIEVISFATKENENPNYFGIDATVTDNTILPVLQEAIINYLENNEYVKRRVKIRKNRLNALINKIDDEIEGIDSLKQHLQFGSILNSSTSGGANVFMMEPSNLYRLSLDLVSKKQDHLGQLELNESFQLIDGFTPFTKPSNPSWIVCLVFGFAGGLVLGFVALFIKEMRSYVRS